MFGAHITFLGVCVAVCQVANVAVDQPNTCHDSTAFLLVLWVMCLDSGCPLAGDMLSCTCYWQGYFCSVFVISNRSTRLLVSHSQEADSSWVLDPTVVHSHHRDQTRQNFIKRPRFAVSFYGPQGSHSTSTSHSAKPFRNSVTDALVTTQLRMISAAALRFQIDRTCCSLSAHSGGPPPH